MANQFTNRSEETKQLLMDFFKICHEEPHHFPDGVGKYDLKDMTENYYEEINEPRGISINTIKKIVDDFLKRRIIECVNSWSRTNLKFKLKI